MSNNYKAMANIRMALENSFVVHSAYESGNYDGHYSAGGPQGVDEMPYVKKCPYLLGYFSSRELDEVDPEFRDDIETMRHEFDPALHSIGITADFNDCREREVERMIRVTKGSRAIRVATDGITTPSRAVTAIANILHFAESQNYRTGSLLDLAVSEFCKEGGKTENPES